MGNDVNPSNEALELDEVETNKDLVDRGVELGFKKKELLARQESLKTSGLPDDNLLALEIKTVDLQLDKTADSWAEKNVWDIFKGPERAKMVDAKKVRFLNKVERLMKREYRQADREARKEAVAAKTSDVRTTTQSDAPNIPDSDSVLVNGSWEEASQVSERLNLQGGAKNTDVLAVESMLDLNLSTIDLTEGDRQLEAVSIAFAGQPELPNLKAALASGPKSAAYKEAMVKIDAKRKKLEPVYVILEKADKAQEDLEKSTLAGTLVEKLKHVGTEFVHNPKAIAGAVGALIGLYLLKDKLLPDDKKKGFMSTLKSVVGWSALGIGGIATADFVWDKVDPRHRGLWDWLGANPNNLVASDVLDKYREYFVGIPGRDKDSMDDMIRILDVDMSVVNDSFIDGLKGNQTIDTRRLLGKGINASTESAIDGASLFGGLRWFYGNCAEKQMAETGEQKPALDKDYYIMGVNWAKKNLKGHKFLSANYVVNIKDQIPGKMDPNFKPDGVDAKAAVRSESTPRQGLIENSHLRALDDLSSFGESLVSLNSGVVLIMGHPFKYYFSQSGEHVFEDALDSTKDPIHFASEGKVDFASYVRLLSKVGEERARAQFESLHTGIEQSRLHYRTDGSWEINPPLERKRSVGLGDFMKGEKIALTFVSDEHGSRLSAVGLGATKAFTSIDTVQKEFELAKIIPAKVKQDLAHLGLDENFFKVLDCVDSGVQSTVTLSYGSGHKGTLVYEGGVVKSISLENDAELQTRWEAAAKKDTETFFSNGDVQDSIVAAIGVDLNTNSSGIDTEFNGDYFGIIGKTFSEAMNFITDDAIEARYKDVQKQQIVKDLRDMTKRMQSEFVTNLYSKNYSHERFDAEKKTMLSRYETEVNTILGKTQDMTLNAAEIAVAKKRAHKEMEEAFEPVAGTSWFNFSHDAFYNERLGVWQRTVDTEIDTLGNSPKKSQIESAIARVKKDAALEAQAHYGKTASDSEKMLHDLDFKGAHATEWKESRDKVYYDLTGAYKWETFGFMSKPENKVEMLKIYDEKIDNGNPAPSAKAKAEDYTTFFLSEVYIRLGGHEDYSLDRFYAKLNSVSDSEFQLYRAALHSIPSYTEWAKNPELRPATPELKDSKEIYRERVKEEFTKWFDENMDLSTWLGREKNWPDTFRKDVFRRFDLIVADKNLAPTQLNDKVQRFMQFTVVEYALYQICIDGTYEGYTDPNEVRDRIIEKGYNKIWPTSKTYMDYSKLLQAEFGKHVVGEEDAILPKKVFELIQKIAIPDFTKYLK